jgi:hypothetical protein
VVNQSIRDVTMVLEMREGKVVVRQLVLGLHRAAERREGTIGRGGAQGGAEGEEQYHKHHHPERGYGDDGCVRENPEAQGFVWLLVKQVEPRGVPC